MAARRSDPGVPDSGEAQWRRRMLRQITWSLLAKLAALALLWWLFFSGSHQAAVTADAVSRHFGLGRLP